MVPLKSIEALGILEIFWRLCWIFSVPDIERKVTWKGSNRWKEFTIDPESMYNKRICFFGRDDDESDSRELFGTVAVAR